VDANRVWAGTDSGLVLIEGGQVAKVYEPQDGLVAQVVTALAVDQETGDLWIAAYGGMSRYSAGTFQNYTSFTSGLANDVVYDVAVQHGVVWAATAAGLSRLDIRSGSWTNFDDRNTPMNDPWPVAISLTKDKAFIATWGSGVLEYNIAVDHWISRRRDENGKIESVVHAAKSTLDFATGTAYDSNSGVLWTATRGGLIRQEGHTWSRYGSENSGLASNFINALRMHDDKLWLCTKRGLSVFNLRTSTWTTQHFYAPSKDGAMPQVVESGVSRKPTMGHSPLESNILNVAFQDTNIWVASEAGLSLGIRDPAEHIERTKRAAEIPSRAVGVHRGFTAGSPSTRSRSLPKQTTVKIGLFGPFENGPDVPYGLSMLHGAQLAAEEANDHIKDADQVPPVRLTYELTIHDDSAPWGASTTEPVKMALNEQVVAILGSIDGSATHTMLRVATELGVPVINTGTADPSISDTGSPWLMRLLPNDEQQSRALLRYIVGQKRIRKVGVLREEARYARFGAKVFEDEVEHSSQLSATEAVFQSGDTDFASQIQQLRDANIDGLVIWCHPVEGALILKQMRASGLQIPIFGPSYLVSSQLIEFAGTAAEGFIATSVLNPERASMRWRDFEKNYRNRFGESPDAYASYAYDGVNLLIVAIEQAGPNRERIAGTLSRNRLNSYEGASGQLSFDGNLNNITPLVMARVEGGKFVYWAPNAVR
jgi:ABC-type branched-subunit amino acid transport system substrate-binding protein